MPVPNEIIETNIVGWSAAAIVSAEAKASIRKPPAPTKRAGMRWITNPIANVLTPEAAASSAVA